MAQRRGRRLNAITHGAFSAPAFLPGEDQLRYASLYRDLLKEWQPDGPTEIDAVVTLATCMWRKRRVQSFLAAQIRLPTMSTNHPIYDDALYDQLVILSDLASPPETQNEFHGASQYENDFRSILCALPRSNEQHLEMTCPRHTFASFEEWAAAIRKEITENVLPRLQPFDGPELSAALSGGVLGEEIFKRELAVDERLDGMIERAIKRLIQTKTMKQLMRPAQVNAISSSAKRQNNTTTARSSKSSSASNGEGSDASSRQAAAEEHGTNRAG